MKKYLNCIFNFSSKHFLKLCTIKNKIGALDTGLYVFIVMCSVHYEIVVMEKNKYIMLRPYSSIRGYKKFNLVKFLTRLILRV